MVLYYHFVLFCLTSPVAILLAVSGQVEFKVHPSKLSWVCIWGACWHWIHLLQAWIGRWKGLLDKAWMVCRLARTVNTDLDFAFCRRCLSPGWIAWTPHTCAGDNGKGLDNHFWQSRVSMPTKLQLYNTCILPIFIYGSECWAVTKVDPRRIDAVDQWCLTMLFGIK